MAEEERLAANEAKLSVLRTSDVGSCKKAPSNDSKCEKSRSINHNSQVELPVNSAQVIIHCSTTQQAADMQDSTAAAQNNPVSHSQSQIHSSQSHVYPQTDTGQGTLFNIMQQQAIKTVSDRDPLQFAAFTQAFELGIERKTTNAQDCLCYLEQYPRGQPRALVRSCQHMMPEQEFGKAKNLLKKYFGHELKITAAYMEKALH